MSLNITENYHRRRAEATTNLKTGVVMISVAIVVGQVYGRAAAAGVVFITLSNYQIVRRKQSQLPLPKGDLVSVIVPSGKKQGRYRGCVAVKETGNLNIQTSSGVVQGIQAKYCRLVQR